MDALLAVLRNPPSVLGQLAHLPGAYLVGGWLRDAWWGQASDDLDIAVMEPLDPVFAALEYAHGTRPFELSARFASHRLVLDDYTIDIMPLSAAGIDADLARRDYTANTLAVPLSKLGAGISADDIHAHPSAIADMGTHCLRMVSRENLADDPVRILRGYRLAANHGLRPTVDTRAAWCEYAAHLRSCAAERLHEELLRWFSCDGVLAETVEWCAKDDVLWQLLPALKQTVECTQNDYHHLDVWQHTLTALTELDSQIASLPESLLPWRDEITAAWDAPVSGAATAGALARLALLLHDVGKPPTREVQPDGHVSFHQHQDVGVELAEPELALLKFAGVERDYIVKLIREHLRLGFYSDHLPLSRRLIYRYCQKLGAATPLSLLHALADCAATRGMANAEGWSKHLAAATTILEHYYARDQITAPPVLLDGNAIMALLDIPAGRVVGELKSALLEATAAGEVEDVREAEEYVHALWKDTHSKEKTGG